MRDVTVYFDVRSEAERAATQLRAAGVGDADVRIEFGSHTGIDRDDSVGVPDSAASFTGLGGDAESQANTPIVMTVDLSASRLDHADLLDLLHAAGGRVQA